MLKEPQNIRYTFNKAERLCSQKIISGLFQPGLFVSKHPFRINYIFTDLPISTVNAQVVFVVGKKRFKRAVDRNRMKRIMRELYRKHKHELYSTLTGKGKTMALALFYTGAEMLTEDQLKKDFELVLEKLKHAVRI